MSKVEIGIFGGSGFYSFLENPEEIAVDTPYGAPSDKFLVGEISGRKVAFLARHGKGHVHPANAVNYRANIWAMKELGVTRIIAPCSCGSLQPEIKPGDFVICDQFVDRTCGRDDTYYKGPIATHISSADSYCSELRRLVLASCAELKYPHHDLGTMVVIQGPRFSTRAESKWFSSEGWEVVGMTQYPEVVLARELEVCYVNISLVTDYDVGLEGAPSIEPVTLEEVIRVFNENILKVQQLILTLISRIPIERSCDCGTALQRARFL